MKKNNDTDGNSLSIKDYAKTIKVTKSKTELLLDLHNIRFHIQCYIESLYYYSPPLIYNELNDSFEEDESERITDISVIDYLNKHSQFRTSVLDILNNYTETLIQLLRGFKISPKNIEELFLAWYTTECCADVCCVPITSYKGRKLVSQLIEHFRLSSYNLYDLSEKEFPKVKFKRNSEEEEEIFLNVGLLIDKLKEWEYAFQSEVPDLIKVSQANNKTTLDSKTVNSSTDEVFDAVYGGHPDTLCGGAAYIGDGVYIYPDGTMTENP